MSLKELVVNVMAVAVACGCGAMDVLVPDAAGRAETGLFRVVDRDGDVLGVKVRAERKFRDAAASAVFEMDETTIRVTFTCPIPPGMTVEKNSYRAWAGDEVEFFIRPSWASEIHHQYCANAAGLFYGMKYTSPDVCVDGWQSHGTAKVEERPDGFTVVFTIPRSEVFDRMPEAGDTFGVNFGRTGRTCGGLSTWAEVGTRFNNIDAFGTVVWGDGKGYFEKRYAALRAELKSKFTEPEKLAAAENVLVELERNAPTDGSGLELYKRIEGLFAELEKRFADIMLGESPLVVYRPADVWSDRLAPDSASRPLTGLRIVAPRGSRTVCGFCVANRKDVALLGQLKLFDGDNVTARFNQSGTNGIAGKVSVSRGFPISGATGNPIYDPVVPLPMDTVLRLAPQEFAPIWLELDTHGIEAGKYCCTLALKPSVQGYAMVKLPVDIEVVQTDLADVACDKAGYDRFASAPAQSRRKLVKFLVSRGYNVMDGTFSGYPRLQSDGTCSDPDYAACDAIVDDYLAAGLPREKLKLWMFLGFEFAHLNPKDADGKPLPLMSGKWKDMVRQGLSCFCRHVQAKYGIGKDRIVWYPVDEPFGAVDDPSFKSKMSIACASARFIKSCDPEYVTMTDPLAQLLMSKDAPAALARLRECYDILELYRPALTGQLRKMIDSFGFKELWTYSILGSDTPPAKYRRDLWENMRDGYREISPFWHMDEAAGGDMFNANDSNRPNRYEDYASLYVDFDRGSALLSRRQLAYDQGCEDARLVICLRNRFKGNESACARVDTIVRQAADAGTMVAMESAREELLRMAEASKAARSACAVSAEARSSSAMHDAEKLLARWCDGMIAHQLDFPHDSGLHGAMACSACAYLHGRIGDTVYPFIVQWGRSGEEKYLSAARKAIGWCEANTLCSDGSYMNDLKTHWNYITVFSQIAIGRTLRQFGARLPQDFRSRLESIYVRQSKWLYDCFRDPKTACKVEVNYWGNYAEAMAEAGIRLNEAKYLDEARKTIDGRLKKLVTSDGMLMGEVIPLDVRTPERGLVAVDLGYNLEETLPAMLAAAEVLKDATFETQVVESAKAHLEFMLPDGAIDDTAGSRAYKWTYSGSRTADGVLPLLARLENRGVKWARRAAERVIALHDRLTGDDGLLYGGLYYRDAEEPACLHHTFTHAKGLAEYIMLKKNIPEISDDEPMPRERKNRVVERPSMGVELASVGPWRATFSASDAYVLPSDARRLSAGGGSPTLLWHETAGLLLAATQADFFFLEGTNQQETRRERTILSATPRLETADGFTSVQDFGVKVKTEFAQGTYSYRAEGVLTSLNGEKGASFALDYRLDDKGFSVRVKVAADCRYYLPVVGGKDTDIDVSGNRATIRRGDTCFLVTSSMPLKIRRTERGDRSFTTIGGLMTEHLYVELNTETELELSLKTR